MYAEESSEEKSQNSADGVDGGQPEHCEVVPSFTLPAPTMGEQFRLPNIAPT